ncbi:Tripartite tricarboxylate transporter TctB family protein [Cohaesibacter sp. ES.047]|uniref:tripartite tricarboxylate transporter TctB family protein n=1 Tax=Cohaesibacter sp. ES.047 TaxID=1798205 RepID=UPI000BBFCA2D|nr:tripartite tricarboxylate transporter TctB family protein [Cohaesibacter sp. ES.047]SNY90301.1 Tripartite tricarboxylate transporter TctB family protein [Cohaesibacter sp. ES.047]
MKLLSGRVLFDIALLLAAAIGVRQAQMLPNAGGISQIGPGDFPTMVCGLGIIAILGVLIGDLRKSDADDRIQPLGGQQITSAIAICALLASYIVLMNILGFIISTTLFLFFATVTCAWAMGIEAIRKKLARFLAIVAAFSAMSAMLVYFTFSYGFGLIFP